MYKFALVAVIGIIPVAAAELALQFGFEAAREAAQDDEDAIVWLILWFASEALFTSFVAALCEETLKLVSDVTGRGETIQVCALIVRVQKGDIPYVVLVLSLSSGDINSSSKYEQTFFNSCWCGHIGESAVRIQCHYNQGTSIWFNNSNIENCAVHSNAL